MDGHVQGSFFVWNYFWNIDARPRILFYSKEQITQKTDKNKDNKNNSQTKKEDR
jgi:hypothetical protein